MSSSPFPILDNRPIDKWKVTELKEELKRRSLATRGLKEELVRRLDEALRVEQEESDRLNKDALVAPDKANHDEPHTSPLTPVEAAFSTETPPVPAETNTTTEASAAVETTPSPLFSKSEVDDVRDIAGRDAPPVLAETNTLTEASAVVETTPPPLFSKSEVDDVRDIAGRDAPVVEEASNEQIIHRSENKQPFSEPTESVHENSGLHNQVSEVITVTGVEVKSDCISTDSVSNNENIELKDNKITDNVKLEQNVNKSQESSTVLNKSHPMDVEEPLEQKIFVGGGDDSVAANADMTKENNIDSEKLNLDRSSGDESMEDELETKQTESITSEDKSVKIKMLSKEESHADTDAGKGKAPENKNQPQVASDKRRLLTNDQEAVGNNEPAKRQRRWNYESIKVPEAQTTNTTAPATTPSSTGLKRDFSRSDSSVSEDRPKERVVPPSPKKPSNSLRIDCFLRPFTLKAVQELLGKTGNVTSFWMDHIKTHCYVSYSSVEEAVATREAVYNLQWPPNGGRLLIAEFVGPEEVEAKLEAPVLSPTQPQPQAQAPSRPPPTALPPPPVVERLPPPPPLVPEEQEPPIVTLDDLFKKTKAIPRIYYLPLSEEQVAAKIADNK